MMVKTKHRMIAGLCALAMITVIEFTAIRAGMNGKALGIYFTLAGFILAGMIKYEFPFRIGKNDG